MLRSTICVFAALSAVGFAEETCSLSGIAVAKSGEPVPNVAVNAVGMRAFRGGDYRTVTTDAEGKFSFAALRCGKYYVTTRLADGGATPLQVDLPKQSNIKLVLPNVDPLSVRLG